MSPITAEVLRDPNHIIIVAGATGDLGSRIVSYLLKSTCTVKALVRKGSKPQALTTLERSGATLVKVDYDDPKELEKACAGASCTVSGLNGLEDVIVGTQMQLLQAGIAAGVPRFIPSDYCIDYTKLSPGSNRNLDLRRKFNELTVDQPIQITSVFNGMFTDLLLGQAPVILSGIKRIVYWGDKKQLLDFTTTDNTAEYTALVALDINTPRYLRIAGDVSSAEGLRDSASRAHGKEFSLLRVGGLQALQMMIKITRTLLPKKEEVFPPWQGMQYLHNMFTGLPKLEPLDNERYPTMRWTNVQELLSQNK